MTYVTREPKTIPKDAVLIRELTELTYARSQSFLNTLVSTINNGNHLNPKAFVDFPRDNTALITIVDRVFVEMSREEGEDKVVLKIYCSPNAGGTDFGVQLWNVYNWYRQHTKALEPLVQPLEDNYNAWYVRTFEEFVDLLAYLGVCHYEGGHGGQYPLYLVRTCTMEENIHNVFRAVGAK